MKRTIKLWLWLLTLVCAACTSGERKWHIGVSQCSEDIWRHKQNYELQLSQYADPRIALSICSADDDDKRQIEQIEQFIKQGIDLLIVAPNKAATLSEIIDKAYDQQIPVILFDRKTNSDKYSAFMGADNYALGQMMGEYIAGQMHQQGTLVEITGLEGSSPAMERHRGFMEAMKAFPRYRSYPPNWATGQKRVEKEPCSRYCVTIPGWTSSVYSGTTTVWPSVRDGH